MSPRGGRRAGAGAKPQHDVAMTDVVRAPVTPVQGQLSRHIAESAGIGVAEWIRSLIDKAIDEHRCEACDPRRKK